MTDELLSFMFNAVETNLQSFSLPYETHVQKVQNEVCIRLQFKLFGILLSKLEAHNETVIQ